MAKKRTGNILDASNEELKNIGKSIMKKTAEKKEPAKKTITAPKPQSKKKTEQKGRDKMLYVAPDTHKAARIQAAQRDMKLKEYITFLIAEDAKNI